MSGNADIDHALKSPVSHDLGSGKGMLLVHSPLFVERESTEMDPVTAGLFKLISDSSITELVYFHNDIRNMIKGHYSHSDNQEAARLNSTLEEYAETLATSCFLLLYARTEETLMDLFRLRLRNKPPPEDGIGRYRALFDHVGLDAGAYKPWDQLQDSSKIRHCLLHANGRIDLMRNPDSIHAVVKRSDGDVRVSNNRIHVGAKYLATFAQVVRQVRDDLSRSTQQ